MIVKRGLTLSTWKVLLISLALLCCLSGKLGFAHPSFISAAKGKKSTPSPPSTTVIVDILIFVKDKDKDKNNAVPNAQVTLFLGSKTVFQASNIADGTYSIKGLEFEKGKQYDLKVEAEGYTPIAIQLSDSDIHNKAIKKEIPLKPQAPNGGAGITNGNSNSNANASKADNTNSNKTAKGEETARFPVFDFIANYWLLALLSVLVLGAGAFAFMNGWRIGIYNLYPSSKPKLEDQVNFIALKAESISAKVAGSETTQAALVNKVETILEELKRIDLSGRPSLAPQPKTTERDVIDSSGNAAFSASGSKYGTATPYSFDEEVRRSYKSLLRSGTTAWDPIYLNADASSSPTDLIEERSVLLQEVGNNQGTFILFSNNSDMGWVFPNPLLSYRYHALKSVYPNLNEEKFTYSKETIEPVCVRRMSEGRWKVDS